MYQRELPSPWNRVVSGHREGSFFKLVSFDTGDGRLMMAGPSQEEWALQHRRRLFRSGAERLAVGHDRDSRLRRVLQEGWPCHRLSEQTRHSQ